MSVGEEWLLSEAVVVFFYDVAVGVQIALFESFKHLVPEVRGEFQSH